MLGAVKGRAPRRAPQAVSSLDRSCAPWRWGGVGTKGVPTVDLPPAGRTKGGLCHVGSIPPALTRARPGGLRWRVNDVGGSSLLSRFEHRGGWSQCRSESERTCGRWRRRNVARLRTGDATAAAAVIADEVENDLLDWPSSEVAVHLQSADDLPTESPDVVAVLTQGLARQLPRQSSRRNGLQHSTICRPGGMSPASYAQLGGH